MLLKTCIYLKAKSERFPCYMCARQGENSSPLMFSIYLAALNIVLASTCTGLNYMNNIQEELLNNESITFLCFIYRCMQMILSCWRNHLKQTRNKPHQMR